MTEPPSPTPTNHLKVFISYSHDSITHREQVLRISEQLRGDGIETRLDQYVNGTPSEGWPRWMLNQLDWADFVLVICTDVYYRRFRGKEVPDKGKGAVWEGALITQELYDARSATVKFVPVLSASADPSCIPEPLRQHTYYRLPDKVDYQNLYDFLLGQAGIVPGRIGAVKRKQRPEGNVPTIEGAAQNAAPVKKRIPRRTESRPAQTEQHSPKPMSSPFQRLPASSAAWSRILPFAVLSLSGFIGALVLLALLLWQPETILRLGLVGKFYYLILLPMALGAAAFLFGALRSYATYSGRKLSGKLELGGPIVGAALVVIGGFALPKPAAPGFFDLTVFVRGEAGLHDLVIRNSGEVLLTLGADLRRERIGDKGQADFKNIPSGFRAQQVPLSVQAQGFEPSSAEPTSPLIPPSITLTVRRQILRFPGRVQDADGHAVTNAIVRIGHVRTNADADGRFLLTLHPSGESASLEAEITAAGFEVWRGTLTPNAGEAAILLRPPLDQ